MSVSVAAPMRDDVAPRADIAFDAARETVQRGLAGQARAAPDHRRRPGDQRHGGGADGLILVNATRHAFKPGPAQLRPHLDPRRLIASARPAMVRPDRRGQALILWYAEARLPNGLVPPILNVDGTVNRGYGSDIEYDAQGEFVGIAADVYRVTGTARFSRAIFEPVVRATRFIEDFAREPTPRMARRRASASSRLRSATRATASPPTATGMIISPRAPGAIANISRAKSATSEVAARAKAKGRELRRRT